MTAVQGQTRLTPEELLQAASQLDTSELEQFTQQVLSLQAQRRANHLESEEELLHVIKEGLSASFQKRYRKLISRRQAEILSEDEYRELLTMTDQAEGYNVKRLEALIHLAVLRGTSLDDVMRDLDIRAQPYA